MLLDALNQQWHIPSIGWDPQIKAINRVLREGGADLSLPVGKDGVPLSDFHHPDVQCWFLQWPGAPICLGAILLVEQCQLLKLDATTFGARWRGDAIDRLRAAIWKEWVEYLPHDARALATQIERSVREQRAKAVGHLTETFDLLVSGGAIAMNQAIANAKTELAKIAAKLTQPTKPDGPIAGEISSGSLGSAESALEDTH
jgi:hypothetical protein